MLFQILPLSGLSLFLLIRSVTFMKNILFFIILLLLLSSGIQKKLHPVREKTLQGAFTLSTDIPFSFKNWFSGSYQSAKTSAINDALGFRTSMIRLNNQVNFSFFNLSAVGTIVVGKSGYLFETTYLESYIGMDKVPRKVIKKKLEYLRKLQQVLEKKGVHFVLIFAPSKARTLPEFIPERYLQKKRHRTNYDDYTDLIRDYYPDLHFIDFSRYFLTLKGKTGYPLYAMGGTHWTNYAVQKVFLDSLLRYLDAFRPGSFPVLRERNFRISGDLQSPDDDIRKTLNLAFTKGYEQLPYAEFLPEGRSKAEKPSLLTISDSYYSMLFELPVLNNLLSRHNFWYYNKTRFPQAEYNNSQDPAFIREDLLKHDFVVLLATDINIHHLFLFPENAMTWFGMADEEIIAAETKRLERVNYYKNAILNDPHWLNDIKAQASKANRPIEDLIRDNAEYMEQMEHQERPR